MTAIDESALTMSDPLPSGTVTLLLADAEGSTRLWQTSPDEMTAAIARLDLTLDDLTSRHNGVRPVEQGEGDSFVIAFTLASDAVACAIALQLAALSPIRLRIGLHTGEVQLRDEGNYIGPTINRAARLRDLGHGGQTLLSGTTADLVADYLPAGGQLVELGTFALRDLPRPERVTQLCHADLLNEFPPLRTSTRAATQGFPAPLTSFIGRGRTIDEVRQAISGNRLVTLTGPGGVGKTRLAIQVAGAAHTEFADGSWYIDLAPVTDADVVPIVLMQTLGLTDRTGQPPVNLLTRFIGDRQVLLVLDNCEHLLDVSCELATALLAECPGLTILATSREPLGVAGEVGFSVPSLSLTDEAVVLFADRARLIHPGFAVTEQNSPVVAEICSRLDGMPLAIELAAARTRTLSLSEIVDSLHDRFLLLTGGARTAVRRQQTLRASVDWSHELLTESERILFRRLAVFMGGFDLQAARAVTTDTKLQPHQVLDQLTLLVDKSLVEVTADTRGRTRYRLLETIRQYSQEKLVESVEAHAVRTRHRDHFLERAAGLDPAVAADSRWRISQAERDIDNLRAAFSWSRDTGDINNALTLTSTLWPIWVSRGRIREGQAWFTSAFAHANARYPGIDAPVWVRALSDNAMLEDQMAERNPLNEAQQALALAREIGDPALTIRALTACAGTAAFDAAAAQPYADEAVELARTSGTPGQLSEALTWRGQVSYYSGDPLSARRVAEEGLEFARQSGDRYVFRACCWSLGWARYVSADLPGAAAQWQQVADEADALSDGVFSFSARFHLVYALVYQGDIAGATAAIEPAATGGAELGGFYASMARLVAGIVSLAAGDLATADVLHRDAWKLMDRSVGLLKISLWQRALLSLALDDLPGARRWADDAVAATRGWHRTTALAIRARVSIAQAEFHTAEQDIHAALTIADDLGAWLGVPDLLECLATVTADKPVDAARLLGAAAAIRQRTGEVRFRCHDAAYAAADAKIRIALGDKDFNDAWGEGAGMSTEAAIGYAQRGRGQRKRPSSGWAALTPAEIQVVDLACEGLASKEIAVRLFISPRTVHAHLTHIYTKLGVSSRVQLAQVAAEHSD